jgi:hypothetical protein
MWRGSGQLTSMNNVPVLIHFSRESRYSFADE